MSRTFLDEFTEEVVEEARNVEDVSADVRILLRTLGREQLAGCVRNSLLAHLTFDRTWFSGFGGSKRRQLASLVRATSFKDAEPLRFVEANLTERARRRAVPEVARMLIASLTEFSEIAPADHARHRRDSAGEGTSE